MEPKSKFRVLVVCTGNICRSPIAEAIFQSEFAGETEFSFASAGLAAPIGRPPDPFALLTASELGYQIKQSKLSERISASTAERSDLILVMESAQRTEVRMRFPKAAANTFLLGMWTNSEIPDPIGRSEEFFRLTAQAILAGVREWVPKIRGTFLP